MAKHEQTPEDEYFAREDVEKLHKLAHELASKRAKEEAEAMRAAHWMKCPHCGNDLQAVKLKGVEVKRCFHCNGTWLDAGGLEKLAHAEGPHRVIDAVVNIFKRPGKD